MLILISFKYKQYNYSTNRFSNQFFTQNIYSQENTPLDLEAGKRMDVGHVSNSLLTNMLLD